MPRKKLTTRVRQEQIAEAALEVVAERGPAGLSVAAIAERVGIVPSAIYRHFGGKEAVLDAVLDSLTHRLDENLSAAGSGAESPLEQLQQILKRHAAMAQANAALPRVLFAQVIYGSSDTRRSRIGRIVSGYLDRIAEVIREGQRRGQIRDDVPSDAAAVVLLGMVQLPIVLWHMTDGDFDLNRQIEQAWPLFERAVAERFSEDSPSNGHTATKG